MKKEAKVIAIASQKGGVGKTTTTRNLAKGLAMYGKKVLVIDCDNQGSLTTCYGQSEDELNITIYDLMMNIIQDKDLPQDSEYIINVDEVDLIPANINLANIEINLVSVLGRETVLKQIVDTYRDKYDYIFMDCMPSLGLMTVNVMTTADSVLIPANPEYLSAKGLEMLISSVLKIKRQLNNKLDFEGIVLTMFKENTNLAKRVENIIHEAYGEHIKIFDSKIPNTVKVGEANSKFKSVIEYAPKHKASEKYISLAEEMEGLK